jgi:hypothetical protein
MRGLNSWISPLSYYSVAMGILTWSAHDLERLGHNLVTGNRLVADNCVKRVTSLTRLVMERGFMGLEWGLDVSRLERYHTNVLLALLTKVRC